MLRRHVLPHVIFYAKVVNMRINDAVMDSLISTSTLLSRREIFEGFGSKILSTENCLIKWQEMFVCECWSQVLINIFAGPEVLHHLHRILWGVLRAVTVKSPQEEAHFTLNIEAALRLSFDKEVSHKWLDLPSGDLRQSRTAFNLCTGSQGTTLQNEKGSKKTHSKAN